jgi:nucleoside-diphosphate-sugar epimerase
MTVLEFAQQIQQIIGGTSEVEFRPLPTDDPKVRQPDISLAKSLLGWEPKVRFEDGIVQTIEYFRHFLSIAA